MDCFFSRRWQRLIAVGLALALLLATGIRVYVHAHPTEPVSETLSLVEAAHMHVGSDTSAFDTSDGATDSVDVSFSAVLKLFSLYPVVALLAVWLSLALAARLGIRAGRLSSAKFPYRDPPYLAPPGHGPP